MNQNTETMTITCPDWCTSHFRQVAANGEVELDFHKGAVSAGSNQIGIVRDVPWDGSETAVHIMEDQGFDLESLGAQEVRDLAWALLTIADIMVRDAAS